MIREPGDAVLDHLEAAGKRADVDVFIREERFDAPHAVEEALPRDIGGVAAKQGGGGVGVRVDESGEDDLVGGIQRAPGAISGGELGGRTHLDDSIALHCQGGIFANAALVASTTRPWVTRRSQSLMAADALPTPGAAGRHGPANCCRG